MQPDPSGNDVPSFMHGGIVYVKSGNVYVPVADAQTAGSGINPADCVAADDGGSGVYYGVSSLQKVAHLMQAHAAFMDATTKWLKQMMFFGTAEEHQGAGLVPAGNPSVPVKDQCDERDRRVHCLGFNTWEDMQAEYDRVLAKVELRDGKMAAFRESESVLGWMHRLLNRDEMVIEREQFERNLLAAAGRRSRKVSG